MTDYRITQIRVDADDGPDFALIDFDVDPNDGSDVAIVGVYHCPLTFGWGPDRVLRIAWARMLGCPAHPDRDDALAFDELRARAVDYAKAGLAIALAHARAVDDLQERYDCVTAVDVLAEFTDDDDDDSDD